MPMTAAQLAAALKRKFKTPEAAFAALGLDEALEEDPMPQLSTPAQIAKGAILATLYQRAAPGKAVDVMALDAILSDITEDNWKQYAKRAQVAHKVQATFKPILAMDADLDDVPGTLGQLPPNSAPPVKPATDQSPEQIMAWLAANCPPEMLAKMKADLGIAHVGEPIPAAGAPPPPAGPPHPPHPPAPDADPMAASPPPPPPGGNVPPPPPGAGLDADCGPGGTPPAHDEEEDDKPMDQTAMDAAIKGERENQRAIYRAVEGVRPWVGTLDIMAFDSAEEVYGRALQMLNVPTHGLHPTALKPVLEAQPRPSAKPVPVPRQGGQPALAADGKPKVKLSAAEAFPGLNKIVNQG